jgi:hypothetical protein
MRKHLPDPALLVLHVTIVSGNHVDMEVMDSSPRSYAVVDAYRITIGRKPCLELLHYPMYLEILVTVDLEERLDVSFGYN